MVWRYMIKDEMKLDEYFSIEKKRSIKISQMSCWVYIKKKKIFTFFHILTLPTIEEGQNDHQRNNAFVT